MLIKKKPFQWWNYRDTRGSKTVKPAAPALSPVAEPRTVKGFISHHILLPVQELPEPLLNRFRADLTLTNPQFEKARKYGKGFVSYTIPEFVRLYNIDTQYLALPRSIRMQYVHNRFADCNLTLELEDIRPEFEAIPFPEKGEMYPLFYQNEAIEKILGGNIVLKFRCGMGKTIMALMAVTNLRLRTLILVRTNILLSQWVESIQRIFDIPEDQIGVINGRKKKEGLITVATEQSLSAMPREAKRHIGETYGHVIIDECLAYETQVVTSRGYQSIGDIVKKFQKGETIRVLSYNEKNRQKEYKKVISGSSKGTRKVLEIKFENGKIIKCTPDHPFLVKGKGWVAATDLTINDDLID